MVLLILCTCALVLALTALALAWAYATFEQSRRNSTPVVTASQNVFQDEPPSSVVPLLPFRRAKKTDAQMRAQNDEGA